MTPECIPLGSRDHTKSSGLCVPHVFPLPSLTGYAVLRKAPGSTLVQPCEQITLCPWASKWEQEDRARKGAMLGLS